MTYLKLSGITRRYGTVNAVAGCSLAIDEGELVSFLGPSGCGKTTTLRIIAGFERADQGKTITRLPVPEDIADEVAEARAGALQPFTTGEGGECGGGVLEKWIHG